MFVNDNKQMLTNKTMKIYPIRTEKHDSTGEKISEAGLDWLVPYLFISLALPTLIQSDDASIRRCIVVNECGAYSRAALFNIFALLCGA